ncbi:MAG: glycosyltransferase family 2 protein [bacterium]
MKISGFTIIRNAIINDYPAVEAISSILPVVDEMIVAVGKGDDDTEGLIKSIGSDKIRIVHSDWDLSKLPGGHVMAIETNKAFQHISDDSDWAFYIQCDEVVHEKFHNNIRAACEKQLSNPAVFGLVFGYVHFYGTYDYYGDSRRWYNKEIRIIRNNKKIYSFKDAQGFRMDGKRLPCKLIDAQVYHYGWVKSPELMDRKLRHLSSNWMSKAMRESLEKRAGMYNYDEFDSLERFTGSHPIVMKKRISEKNWEIQADVTRKRFTLKKGFLYILEKYTGIRPFTFRNYKFV